MIAASKAHSTFKYTQLNKLQFTKINLIHYYPDC